MVHLKEFERQFERAVSLYAPYAGKVYWAFRVGQNKAAESAVRSKCGALHTLRSELCNEMKKLVASDMPLATS